MARKSIDAALTDFTAAAGAPSVIHVQDGVLVYPVDPEWFVDNGRPAKWLPTHCVTGKVATSAISQDFYFRIEMPKEEDIARQATQGIMFSPPAAMRLAKASIKSYLTEIAPAYFSKETASVCELTCSLDLLQHPLASVRGALANNQPSPSSDIQYLSFEPQSTEIIVNLDTSDLEVSITADGQRVLKTISKSYNDTAVAKVTLGGLTWNLAYLEAKPKVLSRHQSLFVADTPVDTDDYLRSVAGVKVIQAALRSKGVVKMEYTTVDFTTAKFEWV